MNLRDVLNVDYIILEHLIMHKQELKIVSYKKMPHHLKAVRGLIPSASVIK